MCVVLLSDLFSCISFISKIFDICSIDFFNILYWMFLYFQGLPGEEVVWWWNDSKILRHDRSCYLQAQSLHKGSWSGY